MKINKKWIISCIIVFSFCFMFEVFSQTPPPGQTTGGVLRQEEQIEKIKKLEKKIKEKRPKPEEIVPEEIAPEEVGKKVFIKKIIVEGVTLIPEEDIKKLERRVKSAEKRLIKGSERKVYLILDNLRVHHSKIVKAWLEDHKEEIEVFYLPSYSPELNPDEYLNGDLKHCIRSGLPARTVKALTKKTRSFRSCG